MPTIRTGNQEWDQSLNTLGNALFPDPSKAAQGYYYGSQARQSQLESNRLIDQQNYRNRHGMMTQGGAQPGPLTFQQPQNVPGAAPIAAPPSNLPMAGAPAAAPSMAATVAASMTPQQAADLVPAAVAPMTTGTPAPVGPPAPGLPPAPQATTSNGQVPTNDYTSGSLHPASINQTGVPVQAPPAQHNGSPAPVPPGMTLPGLLAMHAAGALGGLDAATLAGGGQALAYELLSRKVITPSQYNQMLAGTGQPGLAVADINQAGALAVGAQTQAGETARNAATNAAAMARQQVVTGEARRADQEAPEKTVDANGNPIFVYRKDTVGKPAYDSTVANTRQTQLGAPGQYIKPGGDVTTATAGTAVTQGMPAAPTSVDQQTAQVRARIAAEPDPAVRERLIQQQIAIAATPKELDPAKQAQQQGADYRAAQRIYSVPQKALVSLGVKDPVAFDNDAEVAINQRAYELGLKPENRYLTADPSKAREAAINDLQKNPTAGGLRLPTAAEVAQQRGPARGLITSAGTSGDPRIDDFVSPYSKTQEPTPHMMIRMVPRDYTPPASATPAKGAAAAPAAPAPPATAAPPLSSMYASPGSTAAQSPQQLYGGSVPGATPSPSLGGRIVQGAQAIGQAGRATSPAPMSPAQLYGSQPAAPGAPAAAQAGGPPPGAVPTRRLAPGTPDGPFRLSTGEVGTAVGGLFYPQ